MKTKLIKRWRQLFGKDIVIPPTWLSHEYGLDCLVLPQAKTALTADYLQQCQHNRPQIPAIVSVTSYPARMSELPYCLLSLWRQTVQPSGVYLWLAKSDFPNGMSDLPSAVCLFVEHGLNIEWVDDDKQYKKLLPALQRFPQAIVVTADDDVFYRPDWLAKLWRSYQKNHQAVHAHRVHRVSWTQDGHLTTYQEWQHRLTDNSHRYDNLATGVGGILYPAQIMSEQATDMTLARQLCPTNDDLWWWAMTVLADHRIQVVKNPYPDPIYLNPRREQQPQKGETLAAVNVGKCANDKQMSALLDYFPQLRQKAQT